MRATLGKNQRLKSAKLIREILVRRQSVAAYPLRMLWRETTSEAKNTVAAFFVPKKNHRHAVDRNRIKRLLREAYRVQREENIRPYSPRHFAFIFLWTSDQKPDYASVKARMERVFALWHSKNAQTPTNA